MSKYKCENHKLDLCCLGCVRAWITRHDAMKEFILELARHNSSEGCEERLCVKAFELLKEIGEIEC